MSYTSNDIRVLIKAPHLFACSPPDNHAVDFPATFDIDYGNTLHDNAAAGSTRLGFQYGGENCLEDNRSPVGEQVRLSSHPCHKITCQCAYV
jgi:hypothetical protein